MSTSQSTIVVAGHVCLDLIPPLADGASQIEPGQLYLTGPVHCATGGVVSNTGLALHKLGTSVKLVGKVGDDLFGRAVLDIFSQNGAGLADHMLVAQGANTSYSIVISPPNVDRSFLHCPGANDDFHAAEIDTTAWDDVGLLHFGYPPLMRAIHADEGRGLAEFLGGMQQRGIVTSLDMSMPDPSSTAGRIDWHAWLARVLPFVDLFLPSLDEIAFMLRQVNVAPPNLSGDTSNDGVEQVLDPATLRALAECLLGLGTRVVVLKLGEQGLYLRSGERGLRGRPEPQPLWRCRELLAPCFQVDVAGTTGAGDCTIAGFLSAFQNGAGPEEALARAVAVGACCVEAPDALSGVRTLEETEQRLASDWPRRTESAPAPDWAPAESGAWVGPRDATRHFRH